MQTRLKIYSILVFVNLIFLSCETEPSSSSPEKQNNDTGANDESSDTVIPSLENESTEDIKSKNEKDSKITTTNGNPPPGDQASGDCGLVKNGEKSERIRFKFDSVPFGSSCESEIQFAECINGVLSEFTGTYLAISCEILPRTFRPAKTIEYSNNTNSYYPTVRSDNDGNLTAVWIREGSGNPNGRHWSSVKTSNSENWSDPVDIDTLGGPQSSIGNFDVNEAGDGFAIWKKSGIKVAEFVDKIWSTPLTLTTDTPQETSISTDENGNAIAGWIISKNSPTRHETEVQLKLNGIWGTKETLTTVNTSISGFVSTAINESGKAVIVWSEYVSTGTPQWKIYYSINLGMGWSSKTLFESQHSYTGSIKVLPRSDDAFTFVWAKGAGNSWEVVTRNFIGGNWSAIEKIGDQPYQGQLTFSQIISGRIAVSWIHQNALVKTVGVSSYNGSVWTTKEDVSGEGSDIQNPSISINSKGEILVSWVQGNLKRIYANSFVDGKWGTASLISPESPYDVWPTTSSSISENGYGRIVWSQWNPMTTAIKFNLWESEFN